MTDTLSTKIRVVGFLLIILVVYIHSGNLDTRVAGVSNPSLQHSYAQFVQVFVADGIARVAVPLFFAISGFLFFDNWSPSTRQYVIKIRRRVRTIAVPYLFWSAAWMLVLYILQSFSWSQAFFGDPEHVIRAKTFPQLAYTLVFNPIPFQLWFLRHAFALFLISPVIYFLVRAFGSLLVIVAVILWCAAYMFAFPGVGDRAPLNSLLFFVFGSYLAISRPFDLEAEAPCKRLLLAAWLGAAVLRAYLVTYTDIPCRAWHPALLMLGLAAFWCNYDLLKRVFENKLGLWFTQWTFFIYAAHEPLLVILKKLFLYCVGYQPAWLVVAYLGLPLVAVAIDIAVAFPIKRYASTLYLIATGGR
jgi:peptidoglycan/LPS O-acetylase OafA/YrhL